MDKWAYLAGPPRRSDHFCFCFLLQSAVFTFLPVSTCKLFMCAFVFDSFAFRTPTQPSGLHPSTTGCYWQIDGLSASPTTDHPPRQALLQQALEPSERAVKVFEAWGNWHVRSLCFQCCWTLDEHGLSYSLIVYPFPTQVSRGGTGKPILRHAADITVCICFCSLPTCP